MLSQSLGVVLCFAPPLGCGNSEEQVKCGETLDYICSVPLLGDGLKGRDVTLIRVKKNRA